VGRLTYNRNQSQQESPLQERVAGELGFDLVGHKLELYGVPTRRPRKRE